MSLKTVILEAIQKNPANLKLVVQEELKKRIFDKIDEARDDLSEAAKTPKISCLKCDEVATAKAWEKNHGTCPHCKVSTQGLAESVLVESSGIKDGYYVTDHNSNLTHDGSFNDSKAAISHANKKEKETDRAHRVTKVKDGKIHTQWEYNGGSMDAGWEKYQDYKGETPWFHGKNKTHMSEAFLLGPDSKEGRAASAEQSDREYQLQMAFKNQWRAKNPGEKFPGYDKAGFDFKKGWAQIVKEETLDEISKDTVRSYVKKSFGQANQILKSALTDMPKSVEKASADALKRRQTGIKVSGRRLDKEEMMGIADHARKKIENPSTYVHESKMEDDLEDHEPRIVSGVKGMKSTPFSKKFKTQKHFDDWFDKEGDNHKIHQIERA